MKEKLPLNPKTELMKWGPITARYYFISGFYAIFTAFPKKYPGEFWSKALIIAKDNRLIWINEFPATRKCGQSVFLKYMLPIAKQKKVWKEWKKNLKILNKVEKEIEKIKLPALSEKQFINLWKKFNKAVMGFWEDVVIPELANYGSDKILEVELGKYIKNKTEIASAMEILTAPEAISFYKKEELDLLKTKDIKKHAQKYFWLKNSYSGTELLNVAFFLKRKKQIPASLKADLKKTKARIQKRKKELIKKYNIKKKTVRIADAIVEGLEWQDERKADIFVYLHYKDLLIKETARRLSISKDKLLNFGAEEIIKFFKGKSKNKIKNRTKEFAVIMEKNKIKYIDSKTAKRFWNIYVEEKVSNKIKALKGIVASKGNGIVMAKVRIILDPKKTAHFKRGEILVAPMTSPDYIFAMKKSAAVITDAGGLTSHVAIVSRELGIPCIVGTKIATKVLKDGDLVEVDANKGIVRIIKQ